MARTTRETSRVIRLKIQECAETPTSGGRVREPTRDFDVRVAHRAARTLSESVVFGSFLEFDSVELLRSGGRDYI